MGNQGSYNAHYLNGDILNIRAKNWTEAWTIANEKENLKWVLSVERSDSDSCDGNFRRDSKEDNEK